MIVYRDPSKHPRLSAEEHEYIRAGGATPEGSAPSGEVAMLGYLLRNRKVWGLTIGFAGYGHSFYLFLTWLPNYLVETMHMSILKSAGFAAIPWGCATVADLVVGGRPIDHLIARGYDETPARKTVLVLGMLLGLAVFGATFTTSPVWAVAWISIALSGLAAAAPVGWSIPSLIAPRGGTGAIGGIMNFFNNLMGVVAPVTTGYIVGATHSFTGAFLIAGVVLIVGIIAYVILLGRLAPIADPPAIGVVASAPVRGRRPTIARAHCLLSPRGLAQRLCAIMRKHLPAMKVDMVEPRTHPGIWGIDRRPTMTPRVKEILSGYGADNVGTLNNLARLLNHGRLAGTGKLVILPVDQGFEHGPARSFVPNPPAYNPLYHFELAIEAGCNAYAAPLGLLEAGARDFTGEIPLILKANDNDVLLEEKDPNQALTASVQDALRLGCCAIGFTIYPGSAHQLKMYGQLRAYAEEAKRNGLAVVTWSYPRGSGLSKDGESAIDVVGYAVQIAAQLGVHIIKVKLPTAHIEQDAARKVYEERRIAIATPAERVRHVVDCAFAGRRIVIFSGGAAVFDDDKLLDEIRSIHAGGGFGSIIGRNSFQRPKDEALRMPGAVMNIYAMAPDQDRTH